MGVITTKKSLVQLEKLSTASFCRRRLAVVMVRAPAGRPPPPHACRAPALRILMRRAPLASHADRPQPPPGQGLHNKLLHACLLLQVRLKMSETLREACTFIEQGHVRVGPDTGGAAQPGAGAGQQPRGGLPAPCSRQQGSWGGGVAACPSWEALPAGGLEQGARLQAPVAGDPGAPKERLGCARHGASPLTCPSCPGCRCSDRPRLPGDPQHGGLCHLVRPPPPRLWAPGCQPFLAAFARLLCMPPPCPPAEGTLRQRT